MKSTDVIALWVVFVACYHDDHTCPSRPSVCGEPSKFLGVSLGYLGVAYIVAGRLAIITLKHWKVSRENYIEARLKKPPVNAGVVP